MRSRAPELLHAIVGACGTAILLACAHICALFAGFGLPATLALSLPAAAVWFVYWIRKTGPEAAAADKRLLIVVAVTTAAACLVVKAHGAYDAWLHWNSLARYMTDPRYFGALKQPDSLWHADYPPGLPAPIALIWRLSGADPEWVPRIFSFLYFLSIPLLLCHEAFAVKRFRWLWIAILALFTVNVESLSQGLNQYADVPLALFFLLALMCWREAGPGSRLHWTLSCGLMLGGCLLMKNEGAVIVIAFFLSRVRALCGLRKLVPLLAGIILPLTVLVCYKRVIPNPNDVISGMRANPLLHLLEWERYRLIGYHVARFAALRFPLFIVFFSAAAWLLRKERRPVGPDLRCIGLCAAGYLLVYLTTDIGLGWLVPTSMNRLMMQLLPAGVYLVIRSLHQPPASEQLAAADRH